ncbi:hypothetical protein LMG31506_02144 [Cupriavidus yeoncheonensis]|uniref:Lipoprotein n=1 Tax=Cupriavidus yeoncheonensis TaxID=1462994 RepID=A0A916MUU5_9BURK|nr:hypothetical protein [Cupriavidus yeoncheonensis]CAG2139634.1 hypothetical protein LMG31506_02144 [Cupriavidus yeoncheonensis]
MKIKLLVSTLAAAALSACGGGSDSQPSAPAATTPSTPTTKIAGTAAVGAALANATVQAKCASGSGTATTAADGTFSIDIPNARRPCVLSVSTPDGTTLHSVVEAGSGMTATANITPLTELITASIAGKSTNEFFASFDEQAQAKLTTDGVSTALDNVKLILTGTVDLAGIDPLKDTLVAAHGNTPGNALDQKLDTLGETLKASQTSISDLSTAVASNSGSAGGVQTILQPASTTCASFRSGKYQKIGLTTNVVQRYTIDAIKLTQTNDSTNAVEQFAANNSEACRFGNNDFRLLASKSGIALERRAGVNTNSSSLVIPEQSIPLSELAGDWVALAFERDGNASNLGTGLVKFSMDSTGKFTSGADCSLSSCDAWAAADLPAASANPDGGFNIADPSGTARAFAFKGVDGQLAIAIVHQNGFMLAARPRTLGLPAVGTVNTYWDAALNPTGATNITDGSNTVVSVDTAANTYTRQHADGHFDTWQINVPFVGVRYRAPAQGVNEVVSLNLANSGLSAVISVNPSNVFYSISINRP